MTRIRDAAGLASAGMIIAGGIVAALTIIVMVEAVTRTLALGVGVAEMRNRKKRGKA